jgi:hypothetical protein
MLSFAADFWPLFWAIMGAGALITVTLSVLIATISPAGSRPSRGHRLTLTTPELSGRQSGHGYPASQGTKAA